MKLSKFIKKVLITTVVAGVALVTLGAGTAHAAQIPYVPGQPLPAPGTPAFNIYTNVPYGIGDESDFVRLRSSNGDPTVPAVDANFVDPYNDACNVGSMYDIRTYVHNGADPTGNDNGNGVAVAHNVQLAMTAPLNTTKKNFTFRSTISASNASTVTDTGTLNCGSNVQLKLVPHTVHVYSRSLGWKQASDSAVNGTMALGSESQGSGDVWACWDERIVVVYTVKVVAAPQAPVYTCDLLSVTKLDNRKYKFSVKYTAKNGATFKSVSYDYGDGNKGSDDTHTYATDGTFNVVATVSFMVNGQVQTATSNACAKPLTVTKENCTIPGKENYPKDAPECRETPVELPNTGAGSVAGIFAAVSAAGALAYRFALRRRASL